MLIYYRYLRSFTNVLLIICFRYFLGSLFVHLVPPINSETRFFELEGQDVQQTISPPLRSLFFLRRYPSELHISYLHFPSRHISRHGRGYVILSSVNVALQVCIHEK